MRKKWIVVLTVLALTLVWIGPTAQAQDPIKVGLIMPSSITDLAWSQSMYDGLVKVQEAMGGESALEINYIEGMFDVTAATNAMRDFGDEGYDLVIAHGTQYGSALFELAPDYPETSFAWGTSQDTGADRGLTNVFAYGGSAQEGGYVNGVMAAMLTQSGTVGVVGPVAAGDAILYNNGFEEGVHATNPDVNVLIAYTGSFGDTAAAAEAAQTQIAAGADVLTGSAQQVPGAVEAVQAAGGYWFSTDTDQSVVWPETVVASQWYDWQPIIQAMLDSRTEGVLGGVAYESTFESGALKMAYNEAIAGVAPEIFTAGKQAEQDILAGVVYPLGFVPEEQFKVAVVMPSSITDLAWSQSMYDGLLGLQAQLGGPDAMEIAYTEGMFDVTAAAQALRDYAEEGYDLVIAHGTQYGTSLFELAPDYPDTAFAWGTASDTGADQGLTNVFAYEANAEQGGYVNGVMAAMLSQSGVIGVVGPVAAGDALLYINGFVQGVEATNMDANLQIAYTGSFGDTAAAAETAQTQIAAGADVLTGSAQQVVGAIEAIQAAGGYWFGTQSDQSAEWPETVVASQVFNWTPTLGRMVELIVQGTLGGEAYSLTLDNGGLKIVYGGVMLDQSIVDAANAAIASIKSGAIEVAQELPE
jgi:basic membrane protein A